MDELIVTFKHMIDTFEAAFASIDEWHDKAVHLATINPDLSSSIEELHRNYEQFELVRNNMRHLKTNLLGELFSDAFYTNVVIGEHNTAEPVLVGPVVADLSEVHNTAAPEETAEHNKKA